MNNKQFNNSLEIVRGNLRNAVHVSTKLVKEFGRELEIAENEMHIDSDVIEQIKMMHEEYKKFAETAAFASQQFEKSWLLIKEA